ncbi:Signal recognition particle 54 kDa protein 2 [Euphorbia peplus]|nr:Signal recognition particle 54 kDa protein 2 [Euphorbia peplus]
MQKIKRYVTMIGSMTNEELDDSALKLMNDLRIMRIATDSAHYVREVIEMLEEYMRLGKKWRRMRHVMLSKKQGEMSRNVN